MSVKDFHWGKAGARVKIGIWADQLTVEPGKTVELRAAVRNVSDESLGLGHDFGLAVKHDEDVSEYFGGPRPSEPIFLEPGESKELLGWSLSEESGLKAGINECWIIYRAACGVIQSAVIEIKVRTSTK